MNIQRLSCALAVALIATQVLGPAVLWAADQRGIRLEENRRVLIAAISGEQLMVQSGGESKSLRFRDAVNPGDHITTGDRTVAEVLIGTRAVVTLEQGTTAQFTAISETQTTVQVQKGSVRVAASALALGGQGKITVQTPTGQVQTRGGIIRVLVDAPMGSAEQLPIGAAKPYQASYSLNTLVAAANTRGDIIQVEEGTAEIPGAGSSGGTLTVKSGQSATLQSGQIGSLSGLANQAGLRVGVLASAGHSKTPKEGLENLVTLQVNQATALGKALTGAAETGGEKSGKKDDTKNAINGATGGVSLISNNSLTNSLFGAGNTANSSSSSPQDRTGTGFGSFTNNGIVIVSESLQLKINGSGAALIFTNHKNFTDSLGILTELQKSIFTADNKELMLIGGTPNNWHNGRAPIGTLILQGISSTNVGFVGVSPDAGFGAQGQDIATANARNSIVLADDLSTLDEFAVDFSGQVDGAITATGANVVLNGGVILDRQTQATIGTTTATNNYFSNANLNSADTAYSGSLLAVINGPNGPTSLTMQDRMLGVYDGSKIDTNGGNKALLSVLDARLTGPQSLGAQSVPLIDIDAAFLEDGSTKGADSSVMVTSAVVTRSTIQLDGALLTASAPLLALTNATMTTTSHFADFAGNQNQSLVFTGSVVRGDALVALNAATMTVGTIGAPIQSHLLNLNNATASITGYLFSLTGGSTLTLNNGTLFSLTTNSSLNLTGNAFGVFGDGNNTLSIQNTLCASGCFSLVNSAGTPFTTPGGTTLKVSGVTQNVVLPNSFNAFALAPGATVQNATLAIRDDAALFHVDGTSTLTINGTTVVQ